MFTVFGETYLPPISTNASSTEIHNWKALASVKQCFDSLCKPFNNDGQPGSPSYLSRILEKLWPDSRNAPKPQIAYAVGVCKVILDPTNEIIQVNSKIMKSQVRRNLVSITKL